jgi:uncharacterized membrane protein YvbJ
MGEQSTNDMYQCEQCGQDMQEPATTESFRGHRETVVLAFCRDCTGER